MFNRRRLPLVVAGACLLLASGAAAAEPNAFTAALTPSHVKPTTSVSYTFTLKNDSLSPDRGQRAKIAIPPGFVVAPATVQATSEGLGGCDGSFWVPDGALIADSKIQLRRPGGNNTGLCQGAKLTVSFTATSAGAEGTYTWTTQLFIDTTAFLLNGPQPTVVVDGTAPNTSIDSGPPTPTNQTSASFSFSASEPGSTFECKLDGGTFAACTSPKSYPGLGPGAHTFAVRATDAAGNTDASPATHAWTVDTTAPNTSIDSGPPTPTNQTSASFSFSASEPGSTFECKLDGGTFAACTSPKSYPGLGPDAHTFAVRATDAAGNTDASPATHAWTVDTSPPTVTITQTPNNPSNVKSPTFAFTASEAATFLCKLDTGSFGTCASPKMYPDLTDGFHTFTVKATDTAGNPGAEASYTWLLETNLPIVTLIPPLPSAVSTNTSAKFEFVPSKPQTTLECKLDADSYAACSSPKTYEGLSQGAHTFAVRARDAANNTGPPTSYLWTIDSVGPTAAITQTPGNPTSSQSATFAFSVNEAGSFACELDGGGFGPCSSPTSYQGLGDGPHTFVVRPTDAVGNTGASSSYSWTIDATAPETTLSSGPRSGTTAFSATFTFSASELAAFQCRLDGAAFAPCTSPKSHAGLTRSTHSFEVRAIDAAGNPDPTPAVHRWTIAAAPRTARTTSALLAPRAGARVTSPPRLVWRRLAGASYYNVQLYRGRVKVLSSWPIRTRLQLRARWTYLGRQRRLAPGAYRWYVWPGYGRPSARRYGRLLGQSTFTMAAPPRR